MNKSYIIAITGKGGTGKTTISAAIITCLINNGLKPVLAVDADPNSCLDQLLGIEVRKTVGLIREETRKESSGQTSGISKREIVEMRIAESLIETEDFDLIAMGRPEGPGCYCYANNLFSDVIKKLSVNYPFIVIDNEAGLENLSRRLYQNIDLLIVAGDPSRQGIKTIKRLYDLSGEMDIRYEHLTVILNMARNDSSSHQADNIAKEIGADFVLTLPYDAELALAAEQGKPVQSLPQANMVLCKINDFIMQLDLRHKKLR